MKLPHHCPTCFETHANAFCAECFTPRHASSRGRSERPLKCKTCQTTTRHVVIGAQFNPADRFDLPLTERTW